MKKEEVHAPDRKGYAVMDLGTNVFHLLIVDAGHKEIVRENLDVKLGEGGINKGLIQPAAFGRGLAAMQKFKEHLAAQDVSQVKAIATSALRNAANGPDFISTVREATGIVIEIIDGDKEAGYIYKAVKYAGCLSAQNTLIVDIGGGSVELIICNTDTIHWKQSFEIGAARLMDKFHQVDPIPATSIKDLNAYLDGELQNLFKAITDYPVENMVGSAGAFETYAEIIENIKGNSVDLKNLKCYEFNESEILNALETLITSSHLERASHKAIIPVRIDMIVAASLITRFIIQKTGIKKVAMSTSSLKEGVLADMME